MKTPTFKSLTSLLLFGALAGAQLTGCGTQGDAEVDDAEVSSTTGALSRTLAVADVDTAAVDTSGVTRRTTTVNATTTKVLTSVPSVQLTQAAPPAGTDLERNHPWSVYISGTGGLSCRGTLIHPSWVLTAAHCMGPYAGSVGYTRTDASGNQTTDSRSFDQAGPHRGMFQHPDYVADSGFGQPKNDIMLIRLATPFTINNNIQTAALPRFFANPGRTGTIATNNHSNAPAGYVSIVRTQQLPADNCTAPSGFMCISPPAGSLCKGDSGSGFVEILDGRAQLFGITSNIDSNGDDCIAASKQAELVDVYAYRDWIYGTMGMSPQQADGRVRLSWSGFASQPGIMSLQCLSTGTTVPAVEVSMNVPGSEIAMDNCDDVRVFCQPQGSNLNMSSFTKRTFAANGALTATEALPYFPTFTVAAGDAGSSFLGYNCGVYNLMNPAIDLNGVGLATAAF
jgi:secreted trypsin-like serine protease